jgi:AraC-like DNA-binding protein
MRLILQQEPWPHNKNHPLLCDMSYATMDIEAAPRYCLEHVEHVMPRTSDFHEYLPVNEETMRWGIYMTGIGRSVVEPGSTYPPARHPPLYGFRWERGRTLPEFAVVLVDRGEGVFESKTTGRVPVSAPSAMFLFPGVWHRYRPRADVGWTERWLCFNGELAHRLMEMAVLPQVSPIRRIADPTPLVATFDGLIETVHRNPAANSILLSLHALGFLGAAIEAAAARELPNALESAMRQDATRDAVVSRAMSMIWTRGHHTISVDQIAASVGVTRRTLERRFQAAVGHTVVEEIIQSRLSRAKRLLQETEMSVKVVAQLSGFPSEERMRVAFVRRQGISPLGFRRRAPMKPA